MITPGQQTVAATLDAIDATTEQRCACGCGRTLAVDGPSAWFATEWCQRTWAGKRVGDDSPGADPSGGFFTADLQAADAERYLRYAAESGHQRATIAIASVDQSPWVDVDVIQRLLDAVVGAGVEIWPAGAVQVRLYTGGGSTEVGALTPDPNGDVTLASGRYAFTPASLCPEHARQHADQPAADPMLAAIEARRNRNTGPRPRQRAPRRIDPRRNR